MLDLVQLHRIIDDYFSLDELRTLCFEVGVDFDDLGGEGQAGKARELIRHLDRRGRAEELLPIIARDRPNVDLSAVNPQPKPGSSTAVAQRSRLRPAVGGSSIGHFRGGAATLGCLVQDRKNTDVVYLLCDASGLAPSGLVVRAGDPILQPGSYDGGKVASDVIASLARWTMPVDDPAAAGENISAAIAAVKDLEAVSPDILGLGAPRGVRQATPGMWVRGVGRTSGKVEGQVLQIDSSVDLPWPAAQVRNPRSTGDASGNLPILFGGLIACTPMLAGGDSGMLLLDQENYTVGLGFAGGEKQSFFIPIQKVLDVLEVNLVTADMWPALSGG